MKHRIINMLGKIQNCIFQPFSSNYEFSEFSRFLQRFFFCLAQEQFFCEIYCVFKSIKIKMC